MQPRHNAGGSPFRGTIQRGFPLPEGEGQGEGEERDHVHQAPRLTDRPAIRRSAQHGVALVITLIMLSLVTLMAVVFLAVSRREKISVTVTNQQTDSRLMAEAGTARAVSETIARILATTNPYSYDLIVSTNFINPNGFQPGSASLANIGYTYANGRPLANLDDQLRNLANLQFDPRPPVFVPTNRLGSNEFRFYLDLNRNGRFETNGLLPMIGNRPGEFVSTNGFTTDPASAVWSHFVGDPEWIGVLERPERPHSDSNLFVGRYCYLVLPAGKTLDLNFIHNSVKSLSNPSLLADGFSRNTGLGSWELNLAGFLRDLNTNSWRDYLYRPAALVANTGTSFDDARTLLRYRYRDERPNLPISYQLPVANLALGPFAALAFRTDGLDDYGDGPLLLNTSPKNLDFGPLGDQPGRPWPGSSNPQLYYDVQEVFNPDPDPDPTSRVSSALFTNRLISPMTNAFLSYDRYTFYRYLAQMGTDSTPAASNRLYGADFRMYATNKLHLNYRNDRPDGLSNFIPWDPVILGNPQMAQLATTNPIAFFSQAADRLLRANLRRSDATNTLVVTPSGQLLEAVGPLSVNTSESLPGPFTHFLMGNTPVRTNFGLNNIQLHYSGPTNGVPFYMTNNEYSATTHRLLQVAANLYDATTTRTLGTTNDYPSVFRPYFVKTSTNVIIHGYVEEKGANLLLNNWMTAQDVVLSPSIPTNTPLFGINIYGVPAVIGAKKGYPNFNELSLETSVQVSRKLELRKLSPGTFQTNQMYVVGISNIFGVEAWNSYTQNFQRVAPFELRVTNRYWARLYHVVDNTVRTLRTTSGLVSSTITENTWTNRLSPNSFLLPIQTNVLFLTNAAYLSRRFPFLMDARSTNSFENTFDPPQLFLLISNRLQYAMIDRSVGRIVDFVNLDNLVTTFDISGLLVSDTARTGGRFFSGSQLNDGDLWNTNRVAPGVRSPTIGIVNQINVALGDPNVAPDVWRSHVENLVTGGDKQKSIEKFREFFSPLSTNLIMQVPFTPTRKIYQRTTWQANDPLVHYTAEDLTDPVLTSSSRNVLFIRPPNNPLPVSNLGLMNERYRPWGGNPNRTADATSYRMSIKDPLVRSSDDWDFPANKFPNVGWLGRVHRGTPWQTVYLKAGAEEPNQWVQWAGSYGTHPTNDWKLLDLFTVAPSANAARGLLSVNQTNQAAWSAVLSGVAVLSNSVVNPGPIVGVKFDDLFIQPSSPQLSKIVDGINRAKALQPTGTFQSMGDVLAAPELTIASPFLNLSSAAQLERGLTDVAVERIPQQILSLLKTDDPRIVIYAFGQSLKPAERSLVTAGSYYNICTNYQITGEYATKTVLRIEDAPRKPRAVVESFTILPPE